jgi:hypothetical protein
MIFAGGTIWFVVLVAVLGFFLFAVGPCSGLAAGCDPPGWRQRHRHSVRRQAAGAAVGPICAASWPTISASWRRSISSAATILVANLADYSSRRPGLRRTHSGPA